MVVGKVIYEAGQLKELGVRGISAPSPEPTGLSVWLTAIALAGCRVRQCPRGQMLAVPLLALSSQIVAVVEMVLMAGPKAGESKPQGS